MFLSRVGNEGFLPIFDEGELATWFPELETLLYEEFMKYDDGHGTPHYHGLACFIGKKRLLDDL